MNATADRPTRPQPAPLRPQARSLRADLATVGAGAVASHVLGVVTSLALRALLDPARMGIWQGLKLILSYSNYANLGASKGAARELSRALGRGEPASAVEPVEQALAINTLASGLVAAALLAAGAAVGLWGAGPYRSIWAWGLASTGGLVVVHRHVTYLVTLLRASQRFDVATRITICEALLTLAVGVGGVALWGLPGMFFSALVVLAATGWLARRALPFELRWRWPHSNAARLVRIGGPMLAAGALSSLLRSLDKLMILASFADREYQLGAYSLALLVTSQLYGLANLLGGVLLPRLAAEFGRVGCARQVSRQAVDVHQVLIPLVTLGCLSAWSIGSPALGWLLPEYRSGLGPLAALLPGCAALALSIPVVQYQMAVGDERRALWIVAGCTCLAAALQLGALTVFSSLVALAAATSLGYAVYYAASVAGSLWPRLDPNDRRRYLHGLALLAGGPLAAAWMAHGAIADAVVARIAALLSGGGCLALGWWILARCAEAESLDWESFERRCQKPDHRRIGNWLARRVARPAALRITWLVLPLGLSPHAVTLLAWLTALVASCALGWGTPGAWLAGALLLQLWYLLDHVDGQLARWQSASTLDGVALDYLMHHAVPAATWFGVGWGLAVAQEATAWILVGAIAGFAQLLGGLRDDVRYKAFFQRLKRVRGTLEVHNPAVIRQPLGLPSGGIRLAAHALRKSGEMHVAMCALGAISLAEWLLADRRLLLGGAWLGFLAARNVLLLAYDVGRGLRRTEAETEFSRWFQPRPGDDLVYEDGWWEVAPPQAPARHVRPPAD